MVPSNAFIMKYTVNDKYDPSSFIYRTIFSMKTILIGDVWRLLDTNLTDLPGHSTIRPSGWVINLDKRFFNV